MLLPKQPQRAVDLYYFLRPLRYMCNNFIVVYYNLATILFLVYKNIRIYFYKTLNELIANYI